MPERITETRQTLKVPDTRFRPHIEAALAERRLGTVATVFSPKGFQAYGPHAIGTITYVVAPEDFQTIDQMNEHLSFIAALQEGIHDGQHNNRFMPVEAISYNDGIPQQNSNGIHVGNVDLYEHVGETSYTTSAVPNPVEGMASVYQLAGVTSIEQTTAIPQYVRHQIVVFPDKALAQTLVDHLLRRQEHDDEVLHHTPHSHTPSGFSHDIQLTVPFELMSDKTVRSLMKLPPRTRAQEIALSLRRFTAGAGHTGHHH